MKHYRRRWVWFGTVSHRITGYGTGMHVGLRERDVWLPEGFGTVACMTACGLRIEVHVPPGSVLADAAQPKGRPACPDCEAAA